MAFCSLSNYLYIHTKTLVAKTHDTIFDPKELIMVFQSWSAPVPKFVYIQSSVTSLPCFSNKRQWIYRAFSFIFNIFRQEPTLRGFFYQSRRCRTLPHIQSSYVSSLLLLAFSLLLQEALRLRSFKTKGLEIIHKYHKVVGHKKWGTLLDLRKCTV